MSETLWENSWPLLRCSFKMRRLETQPFYSEGFTAMNRIGKLGLSFMLSMGLSGQLFAAVDFPAGQNCVAWKAHKTMFLFKKVEPVGLHCKLKIQVDNPAPSHVQVTVTVPLADFNSGDAERDSEVRKLLKEDVQPELVFVSDTTTARDWPSYLNGTLSTLKGVLKIGGKSHPVVLQLQKRVDNQPLVGRVDVSLKALEIEAPGFAGGLVAKVEDTIELWFQVLPQQDKL